MLRVVLDSNVLISAFATPFGTTGKIFDAWEKNKFTLVISDFIIHEIERILETKFQLEREFILSRIDNLYLLAEVVDPVQVYPPYIDDNDTPIIGTALAGKVSMIVTGDRALLNLGQYLKIKIISPREFINELDRL